MQPGSNRLNSNAAADRKLDAALSDIFWARRLAKQRAERSHPAERTSATTFEDSAAPGEDRAATEQMALRWISTATSSRDDRCELEDGIRSGLTLLSLRYSPTTPMSRAGATLQGEHEFHRGDFLRKSGHPLVMNTCVRPRWAFGIQVLSAVAFDCRSRRTRRWPSAVPDRC
jgi:hypothetical protein